MEWIPGSIVTGVLIVVGLGIATALSLRSVRLRSKGRTFPLEAASWAFIGVMVGLAALLGGTPARGSSVALTIVCVGFLVGVAGIVTAMAQRMADRRQAARAGLAAGMIPGPPRAPSYAMNGGLTMALLFGPVLIPALLFAQSYEEFFALQDTNYSMIAIVYAFAVVGTAAALLVLWRYLEHRGRMKAHAALEAGMAQRIEDERHDAYRAGFRDGKADAAGYGRGGL